ncbi:MAG: sulfite exporter TauE/SafE family protein [Bacteroidia bacterium]|nr:sulfite exporter TauE/SafE family protein [Bacteroidia bacterium]
MEFEWYIYALAIFGGLIAGFINTIAGSGSLITLPILIFLGLPANIANGTNRVGILLQSLVGSYTLKKQENLSLQGSGWLIIPSIIGAIAGSIISIDVDERTLQTIIGIIMILMLIPILLNSNWSNEKNEQSTKHKGFLSVLIFFLIGIYGGFIQAGVGVLMLTGMVSYAKYSVNHANMLKNLIVFCYTVPVIAVFIWSDQIDWKMGGLLAIGQVTGAWIAANFATQFKDAGKWIRILLIIIIVVSIIKLFNII